MVKLAGPAMSLAASGKLAGTLVFGTWKGRPYARTLVTPANPQSALQVSSRAMLKFLAQAWTNVGSTPQGSWSDLADAKRISPFNAYVGKNAARWREFQAPSQTYPAAETGTEPVATLDSATGGPSYVDLAFTITTLNDVWGVIIFRSTSTGFTPSRANAIALVEVDATGAPTYTDSNLDADTYYYNAKFFTKEGKMGADEGEVNATAT